MSGPSREQLVLFSLESCCSLDFVSGNIRTLGKTKLFPTGPDITECIIIVSATPKKSPQK